MYTRRGGASPAVERNDAGASGLSRRVVDRRRWLGEGAQRLEVAGLDLRTGDLDTEGSERGEGARQDFGRHAEARCEHLL